MKKGWKLFFKIFLTVVLFFLGGYLVLIACLVDLFDRTMFTGLAVFCTFFPSFFLIWAKKKKRWAIIGACLILVSWGSVIANRAYINYEKSLVVNTSVDIPLEEYLPHNDNSKIVKLDKPASLTLSEDLPKLDGAAAIFPVYSAFVDAVYPENYKEVNTDTENVEVFNYYNTPNGYKALAERKTDIFFGAYPSEEQIEYAKECGTEFVFTPIGKEAFVFFVHANSDVNDLSVSDIKRIYTREFTNWSELGFKDQEIIPYQRNEGSGSQSTFLKFMGDVTPAEPTMEEEVDFMMGAYERVANYKNSKGSIGFSFRYYLNTLIARDDIKMLSINGIAPTIENIRSGEYPITGDLYAVTWKDNPNENVQKLLDWICSEEGQYIIEKAGYSPIK